MFMPPFEEGGAYCVAHVIRYVGQSVCRSASMSVGMSVSLNLVQLITQERFAPEASNLVGTFVNSPWWVDDPYWYSGQ